MRGLLIDLDGVVWEGDRVVAGAPETVTWLAANHIPHVFVTNTTSRPRRLIADKLARLGMPVATDKILTPPVAACNWLAKHAPGAAKVIVPDATLEDFAAVELCTASVTETPSAVVIGDIGTAWTYQILNDAFRLLMADSPPQLVALGMTRYWRAEDDCGWMSRPSSKHSSMQPIAQPWYSANRQKNSLMWLST